MVALAKRLGNRKDVPNSGVATLAETGHSFRIGAATTAAEKGVEDSLIKTLGRWESNAYQTYIRVPREVLAETSLRLAR